jgi:type II secretory pathway pseudopilin PulG
MRSRRGFSMVMALIIVVLLAIFSTLILSNVSASRSNVVDDYHTIQSELLAMSATEIAVLAINGHDYSINCLDQINMSYPQGAPIYDINVSLSYIGNGIAGCTHNVATNIATNDSNGSVIVDVIVTKRDLGDGLGTLSYHRRTLQKP